jgi:hypothetical protein
MTEDQIRNAVVAQLGRMKWRVTHVKTLHEHGVDITARHIAFARYFLIEAKGDPPKHVKHPNSGREVNFIQALGQIVTRMKPSTGYYYGIAFPNSYREKVLKRLPWQVATHLKLHVFLVRSSTAVAVYTWKNLRESQRGSETE